MSWRREVEALVGPPTGFPALVVALVAGVAWWRIVGAEGRTFVASSDPARVSGRDPATCLLRAAPDALPIRRASIAWLGVSFLGERTESRLRHGFVAELARVLAPAGTLLVVDHNRPRWRLAAIAAVAMSPRPPGATPAAAGRRLAYPVAREAHAAGFVVDRLRLAAGERVQVISARRART